ncbi:GNAT family N-acetyltransferase [Streptomonospora wellingtoniae]|uniref:GNAT family N-acetyltransferase n=1 Tax=Streptomonospora wellingtoniae TaxID=3075544 RepID=A0ABU2KQK6_9ACTN|nr:GNAT family N-acetyltransferase [Streptomonospora sp. DSM 45055]MDT0301549.1 GNAT family N-acetyltransferase [Streptomonospora sp. DSM 45055]
MIRPARPDDVPVIHRLVRELADYEKEPEAAVATEAQFRDALFGANPVAGAHIAEQATESGGGREGAGGAAVAGFALWFRNFSTWTGNPGIYLEDLYVRPEYRGHGYGKALLKTLAELCVERGYDRLQWWVLDWNTPSIEFYRSLGAEPMDEWTVFRLDGDALHSLGGKADG